MNNIDGLTMLFSHESHVVAVLVSQYLNNGVETMMDNIDAWFYGLTMLFTVAKLSIATGHAMQIYNCLNCPR